MRRSSTTPALLSIRQIVRLLVTAVTALVISLGPGTAASAAPAYVGSATMPKADGYWLVAANGDVSANGNARNFGDMGDKTLNRPIVGMAATPSGNGYWLVAGDGGIFAFGDAPFFGSTGSMKLNQPIVGMASTPSAKGYWMVASDGGIFAFGDAPFYGSTGSMRLNQPIVGMAPNSDGNGYWMVASDGGIFAFGAAGFFGSTGNIKLNQPVVAMSTSSTGKGYWMVASDGGIFAFGDAPFLGSGVGISSAPTIAIVPDDLGGYRIVTANGSNERRGGNRPTNPVVDSPSTTPTTAVPTTSAPTTGAPSTTAPTGAPTTSAPSTSAPSTTTPAGSPSTTVTPLPSTTTTTSAPSTGTTTSTSTTTTTAAPASGATSFKYNFQPAGAATPSGYTADIGSAFDGTKGWSDPFGAPVSLVGNTRERNAVSDQRVDTFIHMQLPASTTGVHVDGTWEHAVANGTYDVTVGVGDPTYSDSRNVINVEGTKIVDFTPNGANTFSTSARVTVSDGKLTVDATGGTNTKLEYIDLAVASGPAPANLLSPATTTTTTTAPPASVSNPGGPWSLVFNDDFNTNAAEGSFLSTYGSKWDAYPWGWLDTSKRGNYDPNILSVSNGTMNMRLHTTPDGKHHVAAPYPKLPGGTNQLYGRYEVRFRADAVDGYKTAWLLWPQSEVWPRDGEIDFPEGDLTGSIHAFMHRQGGTSGGDQDAFGTSARYTDWHTATLEWMPGRVNFILDGQTIGSSTSRVPNTPMHWVLQTETLLSGTVPNNTTGNVQIDRVSVWKYTG